MKLKELKSIVEEREQLKSEIEEIAIDERSKLSERDKVLLDTVNSTITQGPEFAFKVGFPFFTKEAVILLKEKIARIQEIEKIIKVNISIFDIEFYNLKEYLEQYFKAKYNLDIEVRASAVNVFSGEDMLYGSKTDFNLIIDIEGTIYKIAIVDKTRSTYKTVNLARLIIPDIDWFVENTGVQFIFQKDKQNDARAFYRTYQDFKNALWYAISATKKNKLQKDIEFAKNRVEGSTENLENLESTKYLLKLYKQLKEKIRKDIDYQRKKVEENRRELKNLEARLDDYTINE